MNHYKCKLFISQWLMKFLQRECKIRFINNVKGNLQDSIKSMCMLNERWQAEGDIIIQYVNNKDSPHIATLERDAEAKQ